MLIVKPISHMWIQIDVFVCFRIATWIVGDHYMIWCSYSSVSKIASHTDVNANMWWICSLFIVCIVSALVPVADKWWWHYSVSGWLGIQCDWLTDAIKSSSYMNYDVSLRNWIHHGGDLWIVFKRNIFCLFHVTYFSNETHLNAEILHLIVANGLFGAKPLSTSMLNWYLLEYRKQISVKSRSQYNSFDSRKWYSRCHLPNGAHLLLNLWVKLVADITDQPLCIQCGGFHYLFNVFLC